LSWLEKPDVAKEPLAQKPVADFDVEDSCHEGNVNLVHLKNVYDQTHGIASPAK